jgi:predicted DNA-binding protein
VTRLAVKIRLHTDTKERAGYWAAKAGLSANEYMAEAVEEKIARESGDYDVPSFMDKRFSQIIDELKALSTNVASLEVVTVAGNDTIMNLTRGDSYLLDDDDGELASAP